MPGETPEKHGAEEVPPPPATNATGVHAAPAGGPLQTLLFREGHIHELLLIYIFVCAGAVLSVVVGLLIKRRVLGLRRPDEEGVLVSTSWPRCIRHATSMAMMCLAVVPMVLMVLSVLFARVLAQVEGWTDVQAFDYVLSNVADLGTPLTSASPDGWEGDVIDVTLSAVQYVLMSMLTGMLASLGFVSQIGSWIPPTTFGLFRCALLYLPAVMLLVTWAVGTCLARLEGWPDWTGFLFMASKFLDVENITEVHPRTDLGKMFEVTAILAEVGFTGALIGLVAGHPKVTETIRWLEGPAPDSDQAADPAAPAAAQPPQPGAGAAAAAAAAAAGASRRQQLAVQLEHERLELSKAQAQAAMLGWRVHHLELELQQASSQEKGAALAGYGQQDPSLQDQGLLLEHRNWDAESESGETPTGCW